MRELKLERPQEKPAIGIAAARFNHFITEQLVEGAVDALTRNGIGENRITLAWVPGAFELPMAASRLLDSGCEAVVALGAVIRGGTPHFDFVAGECARGIARLSLDTGRPVIFGVLTTDTIEQAVERAGLSEGNKGFDAGMAALHMLALMERLGPPDGPG